MEDKNIELLMRDVCARISFSEQKRECSIGDEQHNADWLNEHHFDHHELIGIGVGPRRYRNKELLISYF